MFVPIMDKIVLVLSALMPGMLSSSAACGFAMLTNVVVNFVVQLCNVLAQFIYVFQYVDKTNQVGKGNIES